MARKPQSSEKEIQKDILNYLRTLPDTWAIKVIIANERGIPDILCCHKGRFYAFEVKGGGLPTIIQAQQILRINQADGLALVVYSVEEVKKYISIKWKHNDD